MLQDSLFAAPNVFVGLMFLYTIYYANQRIIGGQIFINSAKNIENTPYFLVPQIDYLEALCKMEKTTHFVS